MQEDDGFLNIFVVNYHDVYRISLQSFETFASPLAPPKRSDRDREKVISARCS